MTTETVAAPGARYAWLLPLALVVLVTGWAWAPLLSLSFTGEDYVILGRLDQGWPGLVHVFRPVPNAFLDGLHSLFGIDDAAPYHAGSLLVHLLNTCLVFLIAAELLSSMWAAALVAALFGLGAGGFDSLAWIAAANRPIASFGGLLACLGVLRFGRQVGQALAFVVIGFTIALLSNEEAYGLFPLLVGWIVWQALRDPRLRRIAAASAVVLALMALGHLLFLEQIPERAPGVSGLDPGEVVRSIAIRTRQIASGLGLPSTLGLGLPILGGILLFANGRRRTGAFAASLWIASLIPFALSSPTNYRTYPTLAPTALLLGGGLFALVARLGRRPSGSFLPGLLTTLSVVAILLASEGMRGRRLERWHEALRELEICARDARALAEEDPTPPVLVNLELSSVGPFHYFFAVRSSEDFLMRGFLDAASAYEEPGDHPPGRWYGRRFDGTYGLFGPETYFASRPVVEPLKLYTVAIPVVSLEEARRLMQESGLDLTREALVEAPPGALAALDGAADPGTIEIVEPFVQDGSSARMRVRVSAPHPVLFVYQEHWLYEFLFRISPDQAVLTDRADVRRVEMVARTSAGEDLRVFHVNAFGLGVLLSAGEHELDLAWFPR